MAYFPSPVVASGPTIQLEISRRNLSVFLANLRESLDCPPFKKQSEIDYILQMYQLSVNLYSIQTPIFTLFGIL